MGDDGVFDLFVIGGGSGGVRCARIAASLGARVGIAESRFWGGTCVNVGCVPKKILVQAGEYGAFAQDARGFGWRGETPSHDWAALIAAKDAEIARLNGVYTRLLQGSGVKIFEAHARFLDAHTLDVGGEMVRARHIVIATGGKPVMLAIPGAELCAISDECFHLEALPKRIVVVGSGYIGVEFAGIFKALGARVDLVFRQDLPLRGFDQDVREGLMDALVAQGVRVHAQRTPREVVLLADGARRVILSDDSIIDCDFVLMATGRVANTDGLGLEEAGVMLAADKNVAVDEGSRTSVAHIYALGDVANHVNLTPVAIAQGHILAERLFGEGQRDWSLLANVPTAVFSVPPIAVCGLSEDEAALQGAVDVYITKFTPVRHTISGRARKSMMKLVVDQASGRVVGAHMIGDDAPEMMQGISVAMVAGATKRDFDRTVGIHPTGGEEWVTMRTRTRVMESPRK